VGHNRTTYKLNIGETTNLSHFNLGGQLLSTEKYIAGKGGGEGEEKMGW
jgi:hypothetical protein